MNRAAPEDAWDQALQAATIFAVDPGATGLVLRGAPGPTREAWFEYLRALLPVDMPVRRMPATIGDDRLLGGLDLAASLQGGRPVLARGLLAECDGGLLVLAMAERLPVRTAAQIGLALDRGEVGLAREGLMQTVAARVGVVALDEGIADDERVCPGLEDRLALHMNLSGLRPCAGERPDPKVVAEARSRLALIKVGAETIEILVTLAARFGIGSLRAPFQALQVARIAAALRGADLVADDDIVTAVRLVLAPRATTVPEAEGDSEADEPPEDAAPPEEDTQEPTDAPEADPPLEAMADLILAAAVAALPPGLLHDLESVHIGRPRGERTGRAGPTRTTGRRGRPIGTRHGDLRSGRLALVETLRAAAPWQKLRQAQRGDHRRVVVKPDDIRIRRYSPRQETSVIFVLDASGSSALHRLAEVKGAIELLLADCYVRRDSVALVAFRGVDAEIVLPPTRSLARVRRRLAGLPGGGGTPIAAGLEAALALADGQRRKGVSPFLVLLTDGRANVARGGRLGRAAALDDALDAARQIRAAGVAALAIDTAPLLQNGSGSATAKIGEAMAARYIRLPQADAARVSQAVRSARPAA